MREEEEIRLAVPSARQFQEPEDDTLPMVFDCIIDTKANDSDRRRGAPADLDHRCLALPFFFFFLLPLSPRAPYLHNPINVDDVCRTFKDIDLFA